MPFDNSGPASHVYVPVPADRVEDVFRFLLGLEQIEEDKEAELDPLVRRIYRESEEKFRALLELLARQPETPMNTEEIAEALHLYRGTASLAGMLGAFGRRSNNRYDGFMPFERLYDAASDRYELMMPEKIANVVNQVSSVES